MARERVTLSDSVIVIIMIAIRGGPERARAATFGGDDDGTLCRASGMRSAEWGPAHVRTRGQVRSVCAAEATPQPDALRQTREPIAGERAVAGRPPIEPGCHNTVPRSCSLSLSAVQHRDDYPRLPGGSPAETRAKTHRTGPAIPTESRIHPFIHHLYVLP